MPSFDFLDRVELFVRAGTYAVGTTSSSRKVTRAASKNFIYKDGRLWRRYRGRLLRVVRSDEEVREVLTRYHDNNNHAGRVRTVKEIMLMYYWFGVTEAVKKWIKACASCQSRGPAEPAGRFCLAYGCDASSYVHPELSFHRFPKEAERRRRWLAAAQRDEGSLRHTSLLCSRHFEPSCFSPSDDGRPRLAPDAVPTIVTAKAPEDEAPVPSCEDFLSSTILEDLLSTDGGEAAFGRRGAPAELHEHQYCLPAPNPESREVQTVLNKRRKTVIEQSFKTYNQIASYLSHRVLPMQSKQNRGSLKRMTKRFGLIDGVLMYTRTSPPVRVPRSRQEVNSILEQFHDNQGHPGQGVCQRDISRHFYWASLTGDLARWISSCHTCLSRTKRKYLRCSVASCTNCCGPVERGLGLTFHRFPLHDPPLLSRWLGVVGRSNWHPRLRSSVCSTHFSQDCFDRSGDKPVLQPGSVPTLLVHRESASPSRGPIQPAGGEEAFFAKYDAVELYLGKRVYPPGLSYVEKNTFRRFCKKFTIKDGGLHVVTADRVRLVLRSRQQVEKAFTDYHNELNHLDVKKCLRLLSERYFWKTMKSDLTLWINSCSQCSTKKKKTEAEPGTSEELRSPQIHEDLDSGKDEEDDNSDEDEDVGDDERPPATTSTEETAEKPLSPQSVTPINPQPRIPILLHLRTPINLQPKTPIILQPRTPNAPLVARLWSAKMAARTHSYTLKGNPGLPEEHPPPTTHTQTAPACERRKAFTTTRPPGDDGVAPCRRMRRPQARAVIQQCCSAKVKTKPAVDGSDAQWAEIQEGLVVYVCFFHGATEDVSHEMARCVMTTKVFRKASGHCVSVLELPGSVLLLPQDSLLGERAARRRLRFRGGCEPWRGAQLFSVLAAACGGLMSGSARCAEAGVAVRHGVYGQKQETSLTSAEPLTLLLEF